MDKIQLDFSQSGTESIKYNNDEILVNKYISFDQQISLCTAYCSAYFFPSTNNTIKGSSDWDYFGAEYTLRMNILHLCTNIKVYNDDNSIVGGVENIFYSELWDKISQKIVNFQPFRAALNKVVDDIQKQISNKNSLGSVLNGLANKLSLAIDQLSKIDLSPENLQRLKDTADHITKNVENSSVSEIFKEASKNG
jgi:hypothetical protein